MRGAEPCEGERSSAGPPSGIQTAHPAFPGPPKPPGSRGSDDSLLSEGRGSSALVRPQLPPVPPGRAAPRLQSPLHKPAAAATDAAATTVGAKEPHGPQYARNRAASSRAPPPPPSPPPPHGPLLTKGGEGYARLTCALRRARAEGCGLRLRVPKGANYARPSDPGTHRRRVTHTGQEPGSGWRMFMAQVRA